MSALTAAVRGGFFFNSPPPDLIFWSRLDGLGWVRFVEACFVQLRRGAFWFGLAVELCSGLMSSGALGSVRVRRSG